MSSRKIKASESANQLLNYAAAAFWRPDPGPHIKFRNFSYQDILQKHVTTTHNATEILLHEPGHRRRFQQAKEPRRICEGSE